jgi:ABC-type Fe3+ transport system permease subunit
VTTRRLAIGVAVGACWLVFAAAWVYPALGLALRLMVEGAAPDGGWTFSARQAGLLWRTLMLCAAAVIACHLLALAPAIALGRGLVARRPVVLAAALCLLLCPPMVYAFGWQRLERMAGVSPFDELRCVAVWAMWLWPVPAALLAAGWLRSARGVMEAARLEAGPLRAMMHVGLPALARYLLVSVVITFVLLLGEYSVPHACALNVVATELLGWTSNSRFAIDTVWPSLLVVGPVLVVLAIGYWLAPTARDESAEDPPAAGRRPRGAAAAAGLLLVVSWLVPIAALFADIRVPAGPVEVLRIYGAGLGQTIALAAAAGVTAVLLGVALTPGGGGRRVLLPAVVMGALPAALVGEMLLKAYQWRATAVIADHAPVVVLCHLARFGWVGLLAGWLAMRSVPRELVDAARVDGAGGLRLVAGLHARLGAPILACGVMLVAALSAGELAATTVIQPPTVRLIAQVIIEKFHRFEDGMMAWLSLVLVLAAAISAAVTLMLGQSADALWRRRV